jgi:probable addiction module antidote protein
MPKRTRSYDDSLREDLRDPEQAAAYLAASLDEPNDPDSETLFLMALKNVAIAHGMTGLAKRAALSRESLYRALSENGDPKHSTLRAVLDAVGLRFTVHSGRSGHAGKSPLAPQSILVHTWENLVSCDATEWQSGAETQHCPIPGSPRPKLPRRSKEDPSSQTDWSSKDVSGQERVAILATGGTGS